MTMQQAEGIARVGEASFLERIRQWGSALGLTKGLLSDRRKSVLAATFHWGETTTVVALSLGLALVVGRLFPGPGRALPTHAFRAIETKGPVLCDRNDGNHWTACDPLRDQGFIGLRTLDQGSVGVESSAGVKMRIESFSTLLVADSGNSSSANRVTLSEGSVDVVVPAFGPNYRFKVVTPNVTLTAAETAFSVEVKKTSNQPSQTCVRLREGRLSIHNVGRDEQLVAPAVWGCGSTSSFSGVAFAASGESSGELQPSAQLEAPRFGAQRRRSTNGGSRGSQYWPNRLLHRALLAEQRKEWLAAGRYVRHLLTMYPDSLVAREARAILERIELRKTEGTKPEHAKPESQKTESVSTEPRKSDPPIPDLPKADPPKSDAAKSDAAKSDLVKPDVSKSEVPKSEVPKLNSSNSETQQSDPAQVNP